MTVHMRLLEKQLSDMYIGAILAWERKHPGSKYTATPRPLCKAVVTSPDGRIVTLGTFRTRAVMLAAIEPFLEKAESIVFEVTMPGDDEQ